MKRRNGLSAFSVRHMRRKREKENRVPISRVLYLPAVTRCHDGQCLSFIYHVGHPTRLPCGVAFYPLPRTSSPQTAVYINLQLPRRTATMSPPRW